MSYQPPRPPMGMPPMGYQGYGYPMGMMAPMGMGMMPMMRPTGPGANSNDKKQNNKKLVPQEIPKTSDKKEDKPPVTTVFVGNISDRAPDAMVRQMLQRCGNVLSWKRVQGASGKLQAFGFCEYEEPEATLRCIRLLNEWIISEKKLVVKVDAKTKQQLDEWRDKKKEKDEKKENGDKGSDPESGEEDDLDEFTMREDRVAKAGLDAIMREYSHELAKQPPQEVAEERKDKKKKEKHTDGPKDAGIEDMGLEDDKREIINREIRSFRDAHKDEDEDDNEKERERERDRRRREKEYEERRMRERDREREYERERERDREREREKERERERDRVRRERERRRTRSRSRSKKKKVPTATLR